MPYVEFCPVEPISRKSLWTDHEVFLGKMLENLVRTYIYAINVR